MCGTVYSVQYTREIDLLFAVRLCPVSWNFDSKKSTMLTSDHFGLSKMKYIHY